MAKTTKFTNMLRYYTNYVIILNIHFLKIRPRVRIKKIISSNSPIYISLFQLPDFLIRNEFLRVVCVMKTMKFATKSFTTLPLEQVK